MSLLEIHQEAKQRALNRFRKHSAAFLGISALASILSTFGFYAIGIIQNSPLYHGMPIWYVLPLVWVQSFNAIIIPSLALTYVILFFIVLIQQRKESKIETDAEAIYNRFNRFGHKDYSVQIDEAKAGLEYKISEWIKFICDMARRFSIDIFSLKWEVMKLRREVRELRSEVENLKKEKSENEQEISEKAHAQNNTENTKSLDTDEKFE